MKVGEVMKKLFRIFSSAPWLAGSVIALQSYAQPYTPNGPQSYMPVSNPGAMPFAPQAQVGEQPAYVQPGSVGCSVGRGDATRLVDRNGVVIPAGGQEH